MWYILYGRYIRIPRLRAHTRGPEAPGLGAYGVQKARA